MEDLARLANKRVIVTGGLGFIGSNIARRCAELGARVTIYDALEPRCGGNLANVADFGDAVQLIRGDIRSASDLEIAVQGQDVMFNCAAYTSHSLSMRDPLADVDVNCRGVLTLLDVVRRCNPDIRLVHVGSSTQVGRMVFNPVTEDHPEFPLDIYSANKTASEKYVLIYGDAYKIPATVVRLANVYGPRANIRSPDFGFINYFIGLALQGKNLPVYGDGAQLRNVTFVDDVVEALLLASMLDTSERRVLFAVGDAQYTVRQIAEAIVKGVGSGSVSSIEWPKDRAAIEVGAAIISNLRIKQLLRWHATTSLEQGLAKTRDYYQSRLKEYLL